MKKAVVGISLGYACAAAWTIVADVVYNNHVPLDQIQFHGLYPISLGVSAVVACLIFDGNVRALHLRRCGWRALGMGVLISLVTLLIPLTLNLTTGLVHLGSAANMDRTLAIIGLPVLILLALGEETMWRGLLYTELVKRFSFFTTGIIIGLLWALWHFPIIIHTKFIYGDLPLPYTLPVFTIGLVAMNFALMHLRRISDSIWPAVAWHAFANYVGVLVIEPLEKADTPAALFFKADIGVFYALMYVAVGAFFYLSRTPPLEAETAGR